MRQLIAALLCLIAVPAWSGTAKGKKLIEYGWDVPSTEYVRQNVREMEKVPFDGVVIRVSRKGQDFANTDSFGWAVFSPIKLNWDDLKHGVGDLKATKFKRFKHNFIQVTVAPGKVDWFDPQWEAVVDNVGLMARIAKQSGCKGIMFDPEMYIEQLFDYRKFKYADRNARTFKEYQAKVRERGREFMAAIQAEFPAPVILTLYGYSLPWVEIRIWSKKGLDKAGYGLLPSFYDGMLEAASPGTVFVEGYEFSYPYRRREEFVNGRNLIMDSRTICDAPAEFDKHLQVGFANWVDCGGSTTEWSVKDFSRNFYTPDEFRASVNYAMENSDKYVWVYSERLRWWNGANAPKEYVEGLALARRGPGSAAKNPRRSEATIPKAALQPGYSDDATFAEFRKTMTEVFDFPKDGWRFSRDEKNKGWIENWYEPNFDDSAWRAISIGKFWEEQGEIYDGRAWYRIKFTPPAIEPGKRVFLAVGAADETARVWLNGRAIGYHDIGADGWLTPFTMDITSELKSTAVNVLAIQVRDTGGAGGIWKSVKLMAQ
ncbi:MAG: hypothetical protein Q7T82_12865 [Armatimonadota bacterium]|nr:hypothetical protein [Armatimonadota bacterium]